ncbi:MAG: hypothetical protein WD749_06390 [Phycisphaerales bacterium]
MNTRRIWASGAGAIALSVAVLISGAGGQQQPGGVVTMRDRCREASREMGALRREILGIEMRMDKAQEKVREAKNDGERQAALVAAMHELADGRDLITQKVLAYTELLAGHALEHGSLPRDQAGLAGQDCPVYRTLRTTSGRLEIPGETAR